MRDLLNLLDKVALAEGVGLANRKPGEKFKNEVDDLVTFQGLEFYPASGKFPPGDAMSDAIDKLKADGMNIHWTNQAAANSGGFGIASFTGEDGSTYYLGRFYKEISPNRVQNNFPHDAIPGGFKFQSKVGKKENSGYKPSEILTQFQSNTPESIRDQIVAKFGQDSDEARAVDIFMQTDIPCKIPLGKMNAEGFRDYFCEMLQPMALVMGKNVSGNAAEAADIFFGGGGYQDCVISFNSNTIGGLYDSLLINSDGKQIKLSSKGKDGASASVTNLQKSVAELASAPVGQKLLNKYREEIDILNTIEKNGHFGAPLKLAIQYDMLTAEEATQVLKLRDKGPQDKIIGAGLLSKRLESMYEKRKAKDPGRVIPIEHMIAAIAYPVADYINKNTNFGRAAADILNNSALVQMYTDTAVSGDTITITKLTAVYPSQTVTGVMLDASKVYFSTGGKGNYTFTILKNGAKADDVNPVDGVDSLDSSSAAPAKLSTADLDAVTQTPRLRGPGAGVARNAVAPKTDVETLGRARR